MNSISSNSEVESAEHLSRGSVGVQFRTSVFFSTFGRIGGVAFGLVLNLLLARSMSTRNFADFVLNTSVVYFLAPLVSLGSFEVMLSTFSADNRKGVKSISSAMLLTMFGSVVVALGWTVFCYLTRTMLWSGTHWENCLPTTGLVILLGISNFVGDVYRGAGKFAGGSLLVGYTGGAPQNSIAVIVVLIFGWMNFTHTTTTALWMLVMSNLLGISGVICFTRFPIPLGQFWDNRDGAIKSRTTSMLRKSLPILASLILTGAGSQLDILLAASWLSSSEMASYGAARRLSILVGYPYMLFSLSMRPIVSQIMLDTARRAELFGKAGLISTVAALAIAVPMSTFAGFLFTRLYGQEYSSASTILIVLCVGSVLQSAAGFGGTVLHLTLNGPYTFVSQLISLTLYVLFSYAFTKTALDAAIGFSLLLVLRSLIDSCFCKLATGVFPVMRLPRHMIPSLLFPFR